MKKVLLVALFLMASVSWAVTDKEAAPGVGQNAQVASDTAGKAQANLDDCDCAKAVADTTIVKGSAGSTGKTKQGDDAVGAGE